MRILFSITNFYIGGAQTFLLGLAARMSIKHKVYFFRLFREQCDREILELVPAGMKVYCFPAWLEKFSRYVNRSLGSFGKGDSIFRCIKRMYVKFLVKWLRIDIVNSHLFHSDSFLTKVLSKRKIPIVMTEHGCYLYVVKEEFTTEENILRILNRVDGVIDISENNRRNLQRFISNRDLEFRRINNGILRFAGDSRETVQLKRKMGIGVDDFVFGMVARGLKEKGWNIAIEAFKEVQKELGQRSSKLHLVLIGDSDYLRSLKETVTSESLSHVYFAGNIKAPLAWIDCFDVGLLPTYFEGESLPMTIIEYLSCGKPVIASDAGGIRDMLTVEDRYAGIILDIKGQDMAGNVSKLKQAMLVYIKNKEILSDHKNTAEQCFKKFDIENIARQYEDFFQELVKR
jgi:glycosyltransferase involved in cell wall biosynthesis